MESLDERQTLVTTFLWQERK